MMKDITFKVRGPITIKFPLSMLHHDRAYPATVDDAKKIERAIVEAPLDLRLHLPTYIEINLVTVIPNGPDCDRWRRFGWTVFQN